MYKFGMAIDEVDQILKSFEFSIRDLTQKYDSKQAMRLFASNVWVIDHLESKVKKELGPIKKELENLKTTSENVTIQNNAAISIQHIQDIERYVEELLFPYKNNYDFSQIDSAWGKSLPSINEKLKSLRHRVDIIKNTFVTKKKIQDEDWYDAL